MRAVKSLLVALLASAVCLPAAAAPLKGKRPAAPPADPAIQPLKDPMVFYLAKGEANACGPGCSEWIAAEGTMTSGTASRMRGFFKRLGREAADRPIYFYSPGGITSEAMAIGRVMRTRGLTARVARTVAEGCETASKRCASAKRGGREMTARLSTAYAQCNSACVYAIIGAKTREIAPEAHLGVHASKTIVMGYLPKNVTIPAHLRARFRTENRQQLRRYMVDMGIAPALLDAAEKIPHESIRALSRAEMVKFNIDSRSVVESGWIYDEQITDSGGIFKSIDVTEEGGAAYRKTMLRVSCLAADKFMVGYAREVGPKEQSLLPLKLVAANEEFKMTPPAEPVASSDAKRRYDVRRIPVPVRTFESAAASDKIELAPDAGDGKPAVTRFSTIGLASALSFLTRRCSQELPSGGTELVPRQSP